MERLVAGFGGRPMMPLFVEAALLALSGFAVGLLIAYLVALRRRREY
jgi:hypothetical protein